MLRILIIEDELIISRDMTAMLTKMGYDVIGDAMDFDEAIEILERETPDLILLDVNLNGKRDGIDVAAEINRRFHIPFIFTTSYSDSATLERARNTNPVTVCMSIRASTLNTVSAKFRLRYRCNDRKFLSLCIWMSRNH